MVSYVLLVVIAIGLAAILYPYLKSMIFSDRPECKVDISLSVENLSCSATGEIVSFKLINTGFFNVSGAFIRFGPPERSVRQQINVDDETELKGPGDFSPLAPGQLTPMRSYPISGAMSASTDDYILEIQPAIFTERRLVPCDKAIITLPVNCVDVLVPGGWREQQNQTNSRCEGNWDAPPNSCVSVVDNDWESYGETVDGDNATIYINYSKPDDAKYGSLWWFKSDESGTGKTFNKTIPTACFNQENIQFEVVSKADYTAPVGIFGNCWDGSAFIPVHSQPGGDVVIYEEKIWWNVSAS